MEAASRSLRPGLLLLELGLFAAIFWADEAGFVPLSKTPFLLLVAWGSLWLRGLRWRDVGLALPAGWPRLAGIGLVVGVGMWLLEFFVTMPALHRVLGYWPLSARRWSGAATRSRARRSSSAAERAPSSSRW